MKMINKHGSIMKKIHKTKLSIMLLHTHTHTRMHPCVHTYAPARVHARTLTHEHACTRVHACMHGCTHARTHARMHTHARTHVRTHEQQDLAVPVKKGTKTTKG